MLARAPASLTRAHVTGLEVEPTLGLFMFFNQMSSEKTTYPGGKGRASGRVETDGANLSRTLTHLVGAGFYSRPFSEQCWMSFAVFLKCPHKSRDDLEEKALLLIWFFLIQTSAKPTY